MTKRELPIEYKFDDVERDNLVDAFLALKAHPYKDYVEFRREVAALGQSAAVRRSFVQCCEHVSGRSPEEFPFIFVSNVPIDRELPVFDHEQPVKSKHELKRTFVAEAFLALYATLTRTNPIGYVNVNNGDVFQDIYPQKSLIDTQSQKALGHLYFHKDLANHFVRPDYVNMLAMRSNPCNEVYTNFVRNIDLLSELDDQTIEVMRTSEFHTPFDDLTVKAGTLKLGNAGLHPVLSGKYDIRYFESRTKGTTPRAEEAVEEINRALHEVKRLVLMKPGDFISVQNNFCLHGKEIVRVTDPEELKTRWTIKTVNVDRLTDHSSRYVPNTDYLVAG